MSVFISSEGFIARVGAWFVVAGVAILVCAGEEPATNRHAIESTGMGCMGVLTRFYAALRDARAAAV